MRERSAPILIGTLIAFLLPVTVGCDESPPVADVSEELTGGNGPLVASAAGALVPAGYELHEYVAEGTATDYRETADGLPDDGVWHLEQATKAAYRTRILVRRPTDPSAASGTVIVEWLNVSGGFDADADYASLAEEIVRQGHIWVGVSAQRIGIEGGDVLVSTGGTGGLAGKGVKVLDPERYASLVHPGDGFSFDIFTQVARAIRRGGAILGGARPKYLIAAGESQSAMALTTYYDGVEPKTHAFDGYFIHSRASFALPIVEPGESADLLTALSRTERPVFRDDLDAPVMVLEAEGDTVGLLRASLVRQPDSDRYRLWEVAGTAHADRHLLGVTADSIDCGVPINDGPMHVVAKAALRALDVWVRTGTAPPSAPRLGMDFTDEADPVVVRDADGIAVGGVRTPPVDVPLDALTGEPASASVLCMLLGSTTPLDPARIGALYSSRADYEQRYAAAVDATIAAGFVLEEDRAALEAYSQPLRVSP